jgi:hypothetical protein
MERYFKVVKYVDYAGAIASIIWGIAQHSMLWIAFGCVGLVFAWYSPARRFTAYASRRLLGKKLVSASDALPDEPYGIDGELQANMGRPVESHGLYYGPKVGLPFPRGFSLATFEGPQDFSPFARYLGARYGKRRG